MVAQADTSNRKIIVIVMLTADVNTRSHMPDITVVKFIHLLQVRLSLQSSHMCMSYQLMLHGGNLSLTVHRSRRGLDRLYYYIKRYDTWHATKKY